MTMTDWAIKGPEISTCNCDYGCPCQFNALPTTGSCHATVAMHIDKGHHGAVKLDGLRWAIVARWPGPIHLGKGEVLPIVDKRATSEQRDAILKILSGLDTEPGATIFQVFSATFEKVHVPRFETIDFEADMDSCKAHFQVAGLTEATTDAIRNPVTGEPHHAKVSLRAGFEYTQAEFCSGSAKTGGPIAFETAGKHAHITMINMTGKGVVH